MFNRKQNQTTEVPVGSGGTANYPATANYPSVASQGVGYGDQAGRDVNMKAGYGYGYDQNGNVLPQQTTAPGYGGGGYVQQTPVTYGPDGQPLPMRRRSNRAANWCAAAFVACWACTWPCHGPCCCGL